MDFGMFLFNMLYRGKMDNDAIKSEEEANQIAERPLDDIAVGKTEFLLAMNVMGLSAGYDLASLHRIIMSSMKFGTEKFNIMI